MNRIFKLRNGLVFFIGIRTTEYITNVHRLHLMGAMQAIIDTVFRINPQKLI